MNPFSPKWTVPVKPVSQDDVKTQLPLIYIGTFFSVPRTKKYPFLGFSDTLGHTLLTDAQNKLR